MHLRLLAGVCACRSHAHGVQVKGSYTELTVCLKSSVERRFGKKGWGWRKKRTRRKWNLVQAYCKNFVLMS